MGESELSMKLLVNTVGKRVLFAEAGKECVDFLFFILSLPISTLINILGKQQMVGSVANLYESVESLNASYIQPNKSKDALLKPVAPNPGYSVPLLSIEEAPTAVKKFFRYTSGGGEGGFVKAGFTYMVMDDLVVKPMSTISSITLLNQFNISNVSALEEKVVNLGINEAVKLLKASLVSNKVLTTVFLGGKK